MELKRTVLVGLIMMTYSSRWKLALKTGWVEQYLIPLPGNSTMNRVALMFMIHPPRLTWYPESDTR